MTEDDGSLPVIDSLAALAALVGQGGGAFIRYSEGPGRDADEASVDRESGLVLPGLSVNPLRPESWWTRPLEDWLARQVCQYQQVQESNPSRFAWVLDGTMVGRGPDCEPLVTDVVPRARLSSAAVTEAADRYRARFDAGRGPQHDA